MYSDGRQSSRSPTNSQSDSYRNGSSTAAPGRVNARADSGPYQRRSSILESDEREDNDYEQAVYETDEGPAETPRPIPRNEDQYVSALRYRFPNRPRKDYVYSKPAGPTIPPAPPLPMTNTSNPPSSRDAYESTIRPGGRSVANGSVSSNDPQSRIPPLRPVRPEQKNTYAQSLANPTTPSQTSRTPYSGNTNRNNNLSGQSTKPTSILTNRISSRENETNTTGDVRRNTPGVGTATNPTYNRCVEECLERERNRTGLSSQHPITSSVSALEFDHYDPIRHPSHSYRTDHMTTYTLDDIRNINVALSRSGISLFPYERFASAPFFTPDPALNNLIDSYHPNPCSTSYHTGGRRIIGEVVSACRLVEEDPSMSSSFYNGCQAVKNVWNALRQHQPFSSVIPERTTTVSFRDPY